VAVEAGGNVGEVFPLPVARASPPLPERVGPGLKPAVVVEPQRKQLRKAAKKVGLAPLVGESFPR
jgi:hypothetical protein